MKHGRKTYLLLIIILSVNLALRLLVYFNTTIFSFSDFTKYLLTIDNISNGSHNYIQQGNTMFLISYLGYFAKHVLGSLDYFFIFNCLTGTLTGLVLFFFVSSLTGSAVASLVTLILQTLYTEFMVFSSVFYTPVIMVLIISLFIYLTYRWMISDNRGTGLILQAGIILLFSLSLLFKPELRYWPVFLLLFAVIVFVKYRFIALKLLFLSVAMFLCSLLVEKTDIFNRPGNNVTSNFFVLFGHTDYGGDGGEGAFIYPANRVRYETALRKYLAEKNITNPSDKDINGFHRHEIFKYIAHHPVKWAELQFKKFFRTFGIVPESVSFRVLYTGLFMQSVFLTSLFVVLPVAALILCFLATFRFSRLKELYIGKSSEESRKIFLLLYSVFFAYYLFASVFYGHFQERYRIPVMVLFIIPACGWSLSRIKRHEIFSWMGNRIRISAIAVFISVWSFQAFSAIRNDERLFKALDDAEKRITSDYDPFKKKDLNVLPGRIQ